ncbi:MAG: TrkH family potassium uptake protein, partial [Bacteroidetes bacterium]|nr:TrkH family potassium uptake protein [Bacteroidota bacterium]
ILFMFLASANFTLHYNCLQGKVKQYFYSEEFRFYLGVTIVSTIVVMLFNARDHIYTVFGENFRYAVFQVVSLQTSTGFCTADFDKWAHVSRLLLVIIMFFGGCAGSTGGGIKNVRMLLLWRYFRLQLIQLIHPKAIKTVKLQGVSVSENVMQSILGFFFLYILVFIVCSLAVTAQDIDIVTATSAVATTLNGVGPGLGMVGATCNFEHLPVFSKFVLMFCMLVGRLEIFTVVILFAPAYWKECKPPVFKWNQRNETSREE